LRHPFIGVGGRQRWPGRAGGDGNEHLRWCHYRNEGGGEGDADELRSRGGGGGDPVKEGLDRCVCFMVLEAGGSRHSAAANEGWGRA
jgi:hypothetical protein